MPKYWISNRLLRKHLTERIIKLIDAGIIITTITIIIIITRITTIIIGRIIIIAMISSLLLEKAIHTFYHSVSSRSFQMTRKRHRQERLGNGLKINMRHKLLQDR